MTSTVCVKWTTSEGSEWRRCSLVLPTEGGALESLRGQLNVAKLAWVDGDGDRIVLGSDGELWEALRNAKDGVLRLFAREAAEAMETGEEAVKEAAKEEKKEGKGKQHCGVTCDGCEGNVFGHRYKCLVCPDYDLCSACNAKGIHVQHPLIRIADPDEHGWRMHVYGGHPWAAMFGPHGWARNWGRGGGGGRRGFGGHGRQWPSPPHHHRHHHHQAHQQAQQQQQQQQQSPAAEGGNGSGAGVDGRGDFSQLANSGAIFLKEVGETVAAALTNLGIDVDVDVEHPGDGSRQRVPNPAQPPCPQNEKEEETKDKETEPEIQEIHPKPTEEVTRSEAVKATESPRSESPKEWQMVEGGEEEDDGITIERVVYPSVPATAPQPPPPPPPSANGQATAAETAPKTQHHPDPMIHHAVEHMLAMGFTNEGGWLTQLLELKHGNISAALDALGPHLHGFPKPPQ